MKILSNLFLWLARALVIALSVFGGWVIGAALLLVLPLVGAWLILRLSMDFVLHLNGRHR